MGGRELEPFERLQGEKRIKEYSYSPTSCEGIHISIRGLNVFVHISIPKNTCI